MQKTVFYISIILFSALVVLGFLMGFQLWNPIIYFKYFLLLGDLLIGTLILGKVLQLRRTSNSIKTVLILLIISPVILLFIAVLKTGVYSAIWSYFFGLFTLKLGLGTFILVGGFDAHKNKFNQYLKLIHLVLISSLSLVIMFELYQKIGVGSLFIFGILLSIVSFFMVFNRKS